jgi:hypothetical protein
MLDQARPDSDVALLTISSEFWSVFLAHYRLDLARFAASAKTDKSLKLRGALAISESRALQKEADKLLSGRSVW